MFGELLRKLGGELGLERLVRFSLGERGESWQLVWFSYLGF
jgi:hypothetical protein